VIKRLGQWPILVLASLLAASPVHADRIKDLVSIQGVRNNQLLGYGLVVGLDGNGDQTTQTPFTVQSIISMLSRLGVTLPAGTNLQLKNVAAVTVTASLPPFARPGQTIDVTVSSIGNAKSLRGGTLLMTPLRGANGQVYAIAQGNLVVAGAGANATSKAIALSKACAEVGADALLHVTGYYNKPSQEGLYRHFVACADATELPVVLYNVPGRTIIDLENDTIARLAEHERIVAIKDATGNMRRGSQLISRLGDKIAVLSGDDFTTFSLLAMGGRGCVSVVSNAMPAQMAEMCNAAAAGQWQRARELHFELMRLTELLFVESNPVPVKQVMALRGEIEPHVRLPLAPATAELTAELKRWVNG